MKLIALLIATLVVACGSADITTNTHQDYSWVPGQEGRIDGNVYQDGWFNSPEARADFCSVEPEAWFCSDIGSAQQAWVSHFYHGQLTSDPNDVGPNCYGPESTNSKDCMFPKLKQHRVTFDDSACFDFTGHPNPPTSSEAQAMAAGFIDGVLSWNGKGAGVIVRHQSQNPPSWYLPVSVACFDATCAGCDYLAAQAFMGSTATHVNDLPATFGANARKAIVRGSSVITIDHKNLWSDIRSKCSGGGLTDTEIYNRAKSVGMHEQGHSMGFGHYSSAQTANVMQPTSPATCSGNFTIGQAFQDALGAYDSTPGAATIQGGNLSNYVPF